jgi:hypothetical protein
MKSGTMTRIFRLILVDITRLCIFRAEIQIWNVVVMMYIHYLE